MKKSCLILILFTFLVQFSVNLYPDIPASERAALIAIYNSLDGDNWGYGYSSWKSPPLHSDGFALPGTEKNWGSVNVKDNHVISLFLSGSLKVGTIPPEIGNLTHLEHITSYGAINIKGPIPQQLWSIKSITAIVLSDMKINDNIWPKITSLPNLKYLELHRNQFNGHLPSELGNLTNLQNLSLGGKNITGSIPPSIGNLTALTRLVIHNCQLSGSLPPEIGNCSRLSNLTLYKTQLSGSIPPEIGNLKYLKWVEIENNQFSGKIPTTIGNCLNLTDLNLRNNQFSGPLPQEMGSLINLVHLKLYGNRFSGPIPTTFGNLERLVELELQNNRLSGNIPDTLKYLHRLKYLQLSGNLFTGCIPAGLGQLYDLKYLILSHNNLSGVIPNEIGNLRELDILKLEGNRLKGEIPLPIIYLSKLGSVTYEDYLDVSHNRLYADNPEVQNFLNANNPGWEETQTVPPTRLDTEVLSPSSIKISWDPILFSTGEGYYNVFYRTSDEEDWILSGQTDTKTQDNYTVTGLPSGTLISFVVQTISEAHNGNKNQLSSRDSRVERAWTPAGATTFTLSLDSVPQDGCSLQVSPADTDSNSNGTTPFTRTYSKDTNVTLTAPTTFQGQDFSHWTVDGNQTAGNTLNITMEANHTVNAVYITAQAPEISLSRNKINFVYIKDEQLPPLQQVRVSNSGGGTLDWTGSADVAWIAFTPKALKGNGNINVTVIPDNLAPGKYEGHITIMDSAAVNSEQVIRVLLEVRDQKEGQKPFGQFSTPHHNQKVSGSVSVTGWALDDVGVESVEIWRGDNGPDAFVGTAVFVDDARPDIETLYPDYPMNYRAGWGYMLLTNALPGSGDGIFTIHAIAKDTSGNQTILASKTIICQNSTSLLPFGTIDSPIQGGTVTGQEYVNWGWALTPQPNSIPLDGSTIDVYVDGVFLGHPTYNIARDDVAQLFPGYANSNGPAGKFILNANDIVPGMHIIHWIVTDNAGNSSGIGSRYFTVNDDNAAATNARGLGRMSKAMMATDQNKNDGNSVYVSLNPKHKKEIRIKLQQSQRLVLQMEGDIVAIDGAMLVNQEKRKLPVGSYLNKNSHTLTWKTAAPFLGSYRLILEAKDPSGKTYTAIVNIKIASKQN